MKTKTIFRKLNVTNELCLFFFCLLITSCGKDDIEPILKNEAVSGAKADSINAYLTKLSYDPSSLLNVQTNVGKTVNEGNPVKRTNQGTVEECRTSDYSIRSNFEDVAIFDPTLGVVYPGALVIGNTEMLDGAPLPLQIQRAPMKLRLDLPGIGENGTITVDNPTFTNVQTGIDEGLEYWNQEIAPQGYEIASNAFYESTTAYSSQQMSLDLGVGVEWASGSSFESQFSYDTTTEKRVAAILYRQVFYEIVMETPETPASVFGTQVDLAKVQSEMNSSTPPAYVSSVQYGRIIMVRMETTSTETSVELDAALEYASIGKDVDASVEAKYKSILEKSTINVVTIGGNAEIASKVITGSDVASSGGLNYVISEGALYSRENPGAPIAYTIKYLKDNSIAKMGYNTDYRLESCNTYGYDHESLDVDNNSIFDVRFRFIYKEKDGNNTKIGGYYTVNNGQRSVKSPPNGAHDVKVEFQFQDAFVWTKFGDTKSYGYISSQKCFEITNDGILDGFRIWLRSRSCN
ncbi:thiol-activated cytolysin family protein [Maribacter sp. LLG6340-A2]|uniref:thiol-activated cytolysin family protein n=1 Tax=Maribacter sp. LLG6340-A2 TaxID=3160834 RepID=UPI003863E7D6